MAGEIHPTTFVDEFDTTPNATCSLREAVEAATRDAPFGGCVGGSPGLDRIVLDAGIYDVSLRYWAPNNGPNPPENLLANGDINVSTEVEIAGQGPGATFLEPAWTDYLANPLLRVEDAGRLTVSMLTVRKAIWGNWNEAGIVVDQGGFLVVVAATIGPDNSPGIASRGALTMDRSLVTGNRKAGGITITAGIAAISRSTFTRNETDGSGGAIYADHWPDWYSTRPVVELNGVTIAHNSSNADGDEEPSSEGYYGGGLGIGNAGITLANSIIAHNAIVGADPNDEDSDCGPGPYWGGGVDSVGGNVVGRGCGPMIYMEDLQGVDPRLGPLAMYGGETLTYSLLPGSPAIGFGRRGGSHPCTATDQRGVLRGENACDSGAYEYIDCGGQEATLLGTAGSDALVGTQGADAIFAYGGDDRLTGGGGDDRLCGSGGRDVLRGMGGADRLDGGVGRDRCTGGRGRDRARSCRSIRSI